MHNSKTNKPEPSGHIVWEEETSATPQKSRLIRRLYADGRLYAFCDSRRMLQNNMPVRVKADFAWRLDAQVGKAGVQTIERLISEQFIELATNTSTASKPTSSNGFIFWRAILKDTVYELKIRAEDSIAPPEIVREIEATIQSNIIPGGVPFDQE